jgi:hypothetical protein
MTRIVIAPAETAGRAGTMRAVAYLMLVPIEDPQSLVDNEVERPRSFGRQLLVAVNSVSIRSTQSGAGAMTSG